MVKSGGMFSEGEIVVKNKYPNESVMASAATKSPSCTRVTLDTSGDTVWQTLHIAPSPIPKNEEFLHQQSLKVLVHNFLKFYLQILPITKRNIIYRVKTSEVSHAGDLEQNEASRKEKKKRRKKRKTKPPRVEDVKEFHNLTVASERRERRVTKFKSKQQSWNNFLNEEPDSSMVGFGKMLRALKKPQHSQPSVQTSSVLSGSQAGPFQGGCVAQVRLWHQPLCGTIPPNKKWKQREV
ncbi:LOW QUALITY PROTEIN: Selenocysteine insertion sequence-binding protein 2, partial [Plecturocebus cupreus]